jgi:hypothetical protein
MNPDPQYGIWSYHAQAGYYYKICNYFDYLDGQSEQNQFFVIFHPSYWNYFYCYYPTTITSGYYWCRCYSPFAPEYQVTPNYFSVIHNASQLMYQTIAAANPYFSQMSSTPATYPTSHTVPMLPLPSDVPPGLPPG